MQYKISFLLKNYLCPLSDKNTTGEKSYDEKHYDRCWHRHGCRRCDGIPQRCNGGQYDETKRKKDSEKGYEKYGKPHRRRQVYV